LKTLHRYLLRQVIATLLMTAAVFTFVLLLGNALREVLPLLMSQKASLGRIAQAFALLIPWVGVFALPMGMLTATLLVFGRFRADQELTAARASGVSLLSLITPILFLSLALCLVSAAVNLEIGPRSRMAFKELQSNLQANLASLATLQLPERRYISFSGDETADGAEGNNNLSYTVWIDKNVKGALEDVRVLRIQNETNLELKIDAPRGRIEVDKIHQKLILHLYDAQVLYVSSLLPITVAEMPVIVDLGDASKSSGKASITDMTYSELQQEMRELNRKLGQPLALKKADSAETPKKKSARKKELSDITEPYRVQIHRRVAFSFACFGFTLVGIPLGIRMHRRETNIGIVVALLLVAVYYGLLVVAESLTHRPDFAPHLLMWLPNFVFQAMGAVLLWRANRGV
jgi:lipopolysaccharide export system permease protein